ncbi:MAG: hypothetical protein PHQ93_07510 [Sulfurimonas sp.]|uniref:hypothetical protein n=1 Tax=Sulfurimonas sp. TaxID=2022749 RepID=UPI00260451C1|nr:hypothetical protein [Sulfurimonas sp.]MDD5401018.1 hypothetical protein [Sulfurimonas sp.]
MSLKDNITMVKEELNSEEKFFEKAVITEKFIKKYKKVMIASVAVVAFVIAANLLYDANEKSKVAAANAALSKLQADANNATALNELKALSPNLYDVWVFSQAVAKKDLEALKGLKNSKALIVGDLAKYEAAQNSASLEEYASKQDAIFRDLALVESAVMLFGENKIDEAKEKLSKVSKDSSLNKMVLALMHYGIK